MVSQATYFLFQPYSIRGKYLSPAGMEQRESKLHNKEIHDFHFLSNITRATTLRRMGWAGYVARIGEKEMHTEFWLENLNERDRLKSSRHKWEDIIDI